MSGNLLGFDAGKVEPQSGFDVLPAGEYEIVIVASTVKPTANGAGKYLELELQVASGPHMNRKLWDRLNLWNQSAKAQEIARGTLSAICRAVGILTPNDSSELHGKVLRCKVTVKHSEEYGDGNEVKGYKPRTAGPAAAPTASASSAAPWPASTVDPPLTYAASKKQAESVF